MINLIGTTPCRCGHSSCEQVFLTIGGGRMGPETAARITEAVHNWEALMRTSCADQFREAARLNIERETGAREIAAALSDSERTLLLGTAGAWGSWMWECGGDLVSRRLGRNVGGSIKFDTPLALIVIAILNESAMA